jgi:hypothetical protein
MALGQGQSVMAFNDGGQVAPISALAAMVQRELVGAPAFQWVGR